MPIQVVRDDWFENIVDAVFSAVPEAFQVCDRSDNAYMVMFEFGQYILENIANPEIARTCFAFVDRCVKEGRTETEDLIVLQVFQLFYPDEKNVEIARQYLSGESLKLFDQYLKAWNDEE